MAGKANKRVRRKGKQMRIEASAEVWQTALKATTVHAATPKDNIPAISVVHLTADDSGVYAVATDRYTLVMYRLDGATADEHGSVSVRLDDIARIVKASAGVGRTLQTYPLTLEASDGRFTFTAVGTTVGGQLESATFPRFRMLFESAVANLDDSARASDFGANATLLAKWAKTAGKAPVQLRLTVGQKVAVIVGRDFVGLHMPVRFPAFSVPAWTPGASAAKSDVAA